MHVNQCDNQYDYVSLKLLIIFSYAEFQISSQPLVYLYISLNAN